MLFKFKKYHSYIEKISIIIMAIFLITFIYAGIDEKHKDNVHTNISLVTIEDENSDTKIKESLDLYKNKYGEFPFLNKEIQTTNELKEKIKNYNDDFSKLRVIDISKLQEFDSTLKINDNDIYIYSLKTENVYY